MKRVLVVIVVVFSSAVHAVGDEGKPASNPPAPFKVGEKVLPLLQKYCFSCHDADVQKGEVRLDQLESLTPVVLV